MSDIICLQERISYKFHNESLLLQAMTHTSYVNECANKSHLDSNQRLEFLGDSVLGVVVSTQLYQNYTDMAEGKLSRLRATVVCEAALANVALRIGIDSCLLLGHGEDRTGGRQKPSILADAVESLIAAIYIDSDFDTVSAVVLDKLGLREDIEHALREFEQMDYKTMLQEHFRAPGVNINYSVVNVEGPAHNCFYTVMLHVSTDGKQDQYEYECEGCGRSKKEAEQQAANRLLAKLQLIK